MKEYNWKRFWVPREKTYPLDENGFLRNPDNKYFSGSFSE